MTDRQLMIIAVTIVAAVFALSMAVYHRHDAITTICRRDAATPITPRVEPTRADDA
jgi:hypothetical protein